ncbi:MAG: TrbC/VirB2 family protein [Bdellovibrionaceae bacterium]|nr:TrbC/VirB2 family protein [Pseudobdellovibrionaceae bacterium]
MSSLKSDRVLFFSAILLAVLFVYLQPSFAYADFEGSLRNVKTQISTVFLPAMAVIGLLLASFSFLTGNPNSKQHITYALVGAAVGFGAQAIIDFMSNAIR